MKSHWVDWYGHRHRMSCLSQWIVMFQKQRLTSTLQPAQKRIACACCRRPIAKATRIGLIVCHSLVRMINAGRWKSAYVMILLCNFTSYNLGKHYSTHAGFNKIACWWNVFSFGGNRHRLCAWYSNAKVFPQLRRYRILILNIECAGSRWWLPSYSPILAPQNFYTQRYHKITTHNW